MATIKDVAREAGVGVTTVSRVLNDNGYVSGEVRLRIEDAIKKLNYVPYQIARNFKSQRTNSVALLLPTINHPFFAKLAYYIEKYFSSLGVRLIIANTQGSKQKEILMLNMVNENQVDGIIFVTQHSHEHINENIALVSIDAHLSDSTPFVTSENYEGAKIATEYLIKNGCKNIGCICGVPSVKSEVRLRAAAYKDVMTQHNLKVLLLESDFNHGEEESVVREFLKQNPDIDGLLLSSDLLALYAYNILKEMGKSIPSQVQIIGFDGVLNEWNVNFSITTVCQDVKQIAFETSRILRNRIENKPYNQKVYIPVNLHIGSTTQNKN